MHVSNVHIYQDNLRTKPRPHCCLPDFSSRLPASFFIPPLSDYSPPCCQQSKRMTVIININITVQGSRVISGVAPTHLGVQPAGCNQHVAPLPLPSQAIGTIALGNGREAEVLADGPVEGTILAAPQPHGIAATLQVPPGPLQINISINA